MPKKGNNAAKRGKNVKIREGIEEEESVLNEPSNGKQKRKRKTSGEERVILTEKGKNKERKSDKVKQDTREEEDMEMDRESIEQEDLIKVNASFQEGDDRVEMDVTGNDEFLEVNEQEKRDNMEEEFSDEDSETEIQELVESANENENVNKRRHTKIKRRKSLTNTESSDDELEEAELKSMQKFAKFLERSGYLNKQGGGDRERRQDKFERRPEKGGSCKQKTQHCWSNISTSETTIYEQALPLMSNHNNTDNIVDKMIEENESIDEEIMFKRRGSSSSHEKMDSSDDLINEVIQVDHEQQYSQFGNNEKALFKQFLEYKMWEKKEKERRRSNDSHKNDRPCTSRQDQRNYERDWSAWEAQEEAKRLLLRVEKAKETMYSIPGKPILDVDSQKGMFRLLEANDMLMSALVDEDYTAVENHIDEVTRQKIISGQYIDLAKLIPKDKVAIRNDARMELVNRAGRAYYEPVADKEVIAITSFGKWEQAFRVFSSIFTEAYPRKIKELLQYVHIIHTTSLSYVWDNVYAYDMDFRMHMSRHPQHNWGIILNLAWQTRLKEKLNNSSRNNYHNQREGNLSNPAKGNGKNYWKYNRGKCTYGFNRKFDHKCGICGKMGHGAYNC